MKKMIGLTVVACLVTGQSLAQIQAQKYDDGVNASIATRGDVVVETHSSGHWNTLYYRVGIITSGKVHWGDSHFYGEGVTSSITITGNTVIEVHQSKNTNTIWYRVGSVDTHTKTISWGEALIYDTGIHPAVAASGDVVVSVHEVITYRRSCLSHKNNLDDDNDQSGHMQDCSYKASDLYYRIGAIDAVTKTIEWTSNKRYVGGHDPSIALSGDTIIETHSDTYDNGNDNIWYRVGTLRSNTIDWEITNFYDKGYNSSIAISGDTLLEMHRSEFYNRLWYRIGKLKNNKKTISWSSSRRYDRGVKPSVAFDTQYNAVIETHTSDFFKSLYFNTGKMNNTEITWDKPES